VAEVVHDLVVGGPEVHDLLEPGVLDLVPGDGPTGRGGEEDEREQSGRAAHSERPPGKRVSRATVPRDTVFGGSPIGLFGVICVPVTVSGSDIPESGAVLGVDYGTVRIGLALGELGSGLVLPLHVLENPKKPELVVERIAQAARSRDVVAVVIGNPIHMSGEGSNLTVVVTKLRDELAAALGIPVLLRNEQLTSVNAEESLAAAGLKWWQYPKSAIDTLSAMTIVREFLVERNPELGRVREDEPQAPMPDVGRSEKSDRRKQARKKRRRGDDDEG
jgi:putative Holliday junction resolvase